MQICEYSSWRGIWGLTGRSIKPNGQLDFSDPDTVMQLTKTLLKVDFGLELELPDDRLCPPVPNRHNYILWLKDLMDTTSYEEPGRRLSCLDIGTGASCIYPLLGCTQRQWYFVATDIDPKSLAYAKKNVQRNDLENRIRILPRKPTDALIPLDDLGAEAIDFLMTNPPFYESEQEMVASAKLKSRPPNSACTGAPVEMVCQGGEVAFVSRIIGESLKLRERVQWYTSMLGKMSSLEAVVDLLRERKIENYAVTEFVQGSKTRRWAVAWSFGPMRPAQEVARGMKALAWKRILPSSVEYTMGDGPINDIGAFASKIDSTMQALELLSWEWDKQGLRGVGRARENVWSRAWRRRKLREKENPTSGGAAESGDDETCGFGFSIMVTVGLEETKTVCRWVEGHEEVIFTSFCGFLKTQLGG